jgi:hypothetical protein
MLRACGEHVAITIQTSDAKLVGGWEGVRFFSPVGRMIRSITVFFSHLSNNVCVSVSGSSTSKFVHKKEQSKLRT